MTLTYQFAPKMVQDGGVYSPEPIVPVELIAANGRARIRVDALVDTGASHSTWPPRLMEPLGIRPRDCEQVSSVGQAGIGRKLGRREHLNAVLRAPDGLAVWTFTAAALFHTNEDAPTLVGREDFMRYFVPRLDVENRLLHLDPTGLTRRHELRVVRGLEVPGVAA